MKNTRIISAFPACGKTFMTEKGYEDAVILDSDSSKFNWVLDENGEQTTTRNPDFPANYIEHIKENIGKVDYIFISSHSEVRKAIDDSDFAWCCVNPSEKLMTEWVGRCYLRGNSEGFIKAMVSNWKAWTQLDLSLSPCGHVILESGEYILDKMYFIENLTYNT